MTPSGHWPHFNPNMIWIVTVSCKITARCARLRVRFGTSSASQLWTTNCISCALRLACPQRATRLRANHPIEEIPRWATEDNVIRPFRVSFPENALEDLRRRIAAARWPERETVTGQSQGPQLATIQKLARYWATD
jgi:hypothetical protein